MGGRGSSSSNSKDMFKYQDSYGSMVQKWDEIEAREGEGVSKRGRIFTNSEFIDHLKDANWHSERKVLLDAKLTNAELEYIKNRTTVSRYGVGNYKDIDFSYRNMDKIIQDAKDSVRSTQKAAQQLRYRRINAQGNLPTTYPIYDGKGNLVTIVGSKKAAEAYIAKNQK